MMTFLTHSPHKMAASTRLQSQLEDLVEGILRISCDAIGSNFNVTCSKIAASRRRGKADILLPLKAKQNPSKAEIEKLHKDLSAAYHGCKLRLQETSLLISLHRPSTIRYLIQPVFQQNDLYGHNKIGENKTVMVWCGVTCALQEYSSCHIDLEDTRALHVAAHLVQLLLANGYNVHSDCNKQDVCCDQICNMDTSVQDLIGQLKRSKYIIKTESSEHMSVDIPILDMATFIEDENISLGKNNYSINLKQTCREVHINQDSPILQMAAKIDHYVKDHLKIDIDVIIHVVPHKKHLHREMSDILWNMAANVHRSTPRVFCVVESITGNNVTCAEELYRVRLQQVEKAFLIKKDNAFGDFELTEDLIAAVADASLKMELLSVSQTSPVRVNTSENDSFHNNGIFVLYNYVRIQSMLDSFKKSVDLGIYPHLPSFDAIDTSLLTLEEEWNLIFDYIAKLPSILKALSSTLSSLTHVRQVFPTSKICHFLQNLSMDFSTYYSKVHILGESAPHLYERMFARIWLLLALKQVFSICFSLLNIKPPTSM